MIRTATQVRKITLPLSYNAALHALKACANPKYTARYYMHLRVIQNARERKLCLNFTVAESSIIYLLHPGYSLQKGTQVVY